MQRRNSDLLEPTNLRKRTLTASSSVNLDMSRSLSRSNLARSVSGSVSSLPMLRSTSSASLKNSLAAKTGAKNTSVEKLKKDLETSKSLILSLRAEVEQKEQIAMMALSGAKVVDNFITNNIFSLINPESSPCALWLAKFHSRSLQ